MAENTDPSQERPSLPRVIDEHRESQRLDAIVREHPEPQALAEAIAEEIAILDSCIERGVRCTDGLGCPVPPSPSR